MKTNNRAVDDAVDGTVVNAVYWDVGESVGDAVSDAVYWAVRRPVDQAVAGAVEGIVYWAVHEDSRHPGLQDFLRFADVGGPRWTT